MRAKFKKYELIAEVDSAGFEAFHNGDAPDLRAIRVMKQHGIDISGQQARLFRKSDFDAYDRIYVMDNGNFNDVKAIPHHSSHMIKVDYILNSVNPGSNKPVPDPYLGGEEDFEITYQLLDLATEQIAIELRQGGK